MRAGTSPQPPGRTRAPRRPSQLSAPAILPVPLVFVANAERSNRRITASGHRVLGRALCAEPSDQRWGRCRDSPSGRLDRPGHPEIMRRATNSRRIPTPGPSVGAPESSVPSSMDRPDDGGTAVRCGPGESGPTTATAHRTSSPVRFMRPHGQADAPGRGRRPVARRWPHRRRAVATVCRPEVVR